MFPASDTEETVNQGWLKKEINKMFTNIYQLWRQCSQGTYLPTQRSNHLPHDRSRKRSLSPSHSILYKSLLVAHVKPAHYLKSHCGVVTALWCDVKGGIYCDDIDLFHKIHFDMKMQEYTCN